MPEKGKISFKSELFDWIEVVITAVVAVIIIFTFIFRIVTIKGSSMRNTLYDREKVVLTNMFYTPKQGDIVVVSRNQDNSLENNQKDPIIKRVIATEGQTVDIDFEKGVVYVNGIQLEEPYTRTPTNLKYDIEFPVIVPEGCVFCLGDNRNDSLDSRSSSIGNNGMIDRRYILGHAIYRILPLKKIGGLE